MGMRGGIGALGVEPELTPLEARRRAVQKRAPHKFYVEMHRPEKHGNSHCYGFRIHPIKADVPSPTRTTSSRASVASLNEYDIWRKWEDCLWFQHTLEEEYTRAAREKRRSLAAGKGLKKNGIYIRSDQAASWESLPFGPDPNDIAFDIHRYIPKLSKKGTLFRTSQEIVDHRYQELKAMIQALLQDDLPTLIRDIKETHTFTDFFGVWGRDIDLAQKAEAAKKQPTPDRPRPSISSAFQVSMSSFSVKSLSPTKGKAPERAPIPFRTSLHSECSSSEDSLDLPRQSRSMNRTEEVRSMRARASSSGSHSSSSSPSTPVMGTRQLPPTSRQPAIVSQESPIRFGHNPLVLGGERNSCVLESLPEDRELDSSPKSDLDGPYAHARTGSAASRMNRSARVYVPAPLESPAQSLHRYSTASLQSTNSSMTLRATAYLDELDVDYCLPSPTPEPRARLRASVSSLASVVTNSSVDAVIPRSERPSRSSANRAPRRPPSSLPEEPLVEHEPWSEDESQSEEEGDILDAYFGDLIRPDEEIPVGYPETPTVDEMMYGFAQKQKQSSTTLSSYSVYSERRSSMTTSISSGSTFTSTSTSTSSSGGTTLDIKAMHEDNVVVLRVSRYTPFDELRRRIYDKFMQAAHATICKTFAIALVEVASVDKAGVLSSPGSVQGKGGLQFIASQENWDDVVASHGGKLVFRIIGSRE